MEHVKGVEITADPLTKVLSKVQLQEDRDKLQMVVCGGVPEN